MKKIKQSIGIDFGTCKSVVGFIKNNKVRIITNDFDNKTTPCYVAFTEYQKLVGQAALDQINTNISNTVFNVKRLLGRKFHDNVIQQNLKYFTYKIEPGQNDKILIVVQYKNQVKRFSPEQITAMILTKMKQIAETQIGQFVKNAVISIPTYFNEYQRQAIKNAAIIANINLLRLINQPMNISLNYYLQNKFNGQHKSLIFDFGGGKIDLSIILFDQGVFQCIGNQGNTFFGGQDFDHKILDYCCGQFFTKTGLNIKKNTRAMRRLKNQCKKAKQILSSSNQTTIQVDSLCNGQDFSLTLTRNKFQQLCNELFNKIPQLIDKVLKSTQISKNQINEIILAGGSTKIPKIINLIKNFFNGKQPKKQININQAVAHGASIYSSILSGQGCQQFDKLLIIDTTTLAIGIQTGDGIMNTIISANTTIPTRKSYILATNVNNQSSGIIKIFQGNGAFTKDNILLGQILFDGIKPALKGVQQLKLSIQIDQNYVITVKVTDKQTNKQQKLTICSDNHYIDSKLRQKHQCYTFVVKQKIQQSLKCE